MVQVYDEKLKKIKLLQAFYLERINERMQNTIFSRSIIWRFVAAENRANHNQQRFLAD